MTRSVLTPWESIAVPEEDYNVRLVRAALRSPLYWARDASGSFLFIVDLEEDVTRHFRRQEPAIQGLKVELRGRQGTEGQQLALTLEHQDSKDMFLAFCTNLADAIGEVDNAVRRYDLILAHFGRWQRFFGMARRHILSAAETRGLFAELAVMRMLHERSGVPLVRLVDSWNGPEASKQDFHLGDAAIEVKSLLGSARSAVRISSEDQLDTNLPDLYLLVLHLSNTPAEGTGISLRSMIDQLSEGMPLPVRDAFEVKLSAVGYAPLADYAVPEFSVIEYEAFHVRPGFPRLVRPDLPVGVSGVSYQVGLAALHNYRTGLSELLEDIGGNV